MIETIRNNNKTNMEQPTGLFKMPKNIRQIGQIDSYNKIYIEDYVMSFIHQLGLTANQEGEVFILLGKFITIEDSRCTFLEGAIRVKNIDLEKNKIFPNSVWNEIYETIKKYFTEVEIVGWGIVNTGLCLEQATQYEKIHLDNFAGKDKLFLLYDSIEREEAIYRYERNHLRKQLGYYIFYERNVEMQNYMIERQDRTIQTEQVSDRALKEARKVLQEKEKKNNDKRGVLYSAGMVFAVCGFAFFLTLGNHYGKLPSLQDTVTTISNQIKDKDFAKHLNKKKNNPQTQQDAIKKSTQVEIVSGDIISTEEPTATDFAQIKETQKPENKDIAIQKTAIPSTEQPEQDVKDTSTQIKEPQFYIVKKGDTLEGICNRFYQSQSYVEQLKKINGIKDKDKIYIGQKIQLP